MLTDVLVVIRGVELKTLDKLLEYPSVPIWEAL